MKLTPNPNTVVEAGGTFKVRLPPNTLIDLDTLSMFYEGTCSASDAVYNTQEIVANIYKTCLVYNKREIYHNIPQDVAIDTEISIFDKEGGQGKRYKIKEIHEDHFTIDEDIDTDDCFVFGYEVNDLIGLDKSYIYTLNVCAP